MDLIDQIRGIAARYSESDSHINTEEATKNALIMPFINALGYNVFDPTEVVPEYIADLGVKKGEKVDYAIIIEGKPLILFECKRVGTKMDISHASQLFRYFTVTDARIGVLTNGLEYKLFSDLEAANKMDTRPFLEFDIRGVSDSTVNELKKLSKSTFDLEEVLSSANELKYLRAMKGVLHKQLQNPEDEFVKYLISEVYDGRLTQNVKDQFAGLVKRAFHQFVNDRINERLSTALVKDENYIEDAPTVTDNGQSMKEIAEEPQIVTTEEELEAYYIVRAILRESTEVSRVAARDVNSYFGVLLDDNNRKPICRFHFNGSQKYLELFNEKKEGTKAKISSLDQIYDHAEHLKRTISFYEN